ncbi:hypothetical protein SBRCBS47491_007176 [Sporothrix bragantina]|uniref:Uncharacterized protein n=1 Tax=Sporothrix bragantina TaxID=671064 RepID=A0ABP0CBM7_9PEZI
MAIKTTTAAAMQHGHRRRLRQHAMLPLGKRSSQLAARFMAEKRIKHEQRQIQKQQEQQKQEQSMSIVSSATATPEPTTPPTKHQGTMPTNENKQSLQHILGRNFDDKDRSAADILATLYQTGLLDRQTPTASERSASGTATPVDGDDVQPSEVALPSMQQTEVMLEVWWSEGNKKASKTASSAEKAESIVDEQAASSPMTPALSASSSASARSSFSVDSQAKEDNHFHHSVYNRQTSPASQYAHMPSPSGPPPPPYDQWRKSIAVADSSALTPAVSAAPKALPLAQPQPRAAVQQQHQSPFSTYEQNYFCSSRQSQNSHGQEATGPNGMPSPPQSPTDAGRPSEFSNSSSNKPMLPTLPPLSSTLPTPPQSFSASMQPQQPEYQPQAAYSSSSSAYQPRFHHQFELPAPMPTVHRRSIVNEDIATTVLTLPGLGSSSSSAREPLTPVSPLTLPSAFGRRSTMPAMPSMASMMNNTSQYHSHYHNSHHHDLSPRMAAKLDARRARMSASAASSSSAAPASGKKTAMPKPHCNVKYETAELDFIMYQRTTKNRAWDDVTASFNAALPRLRQYADMDYARMGGAGASGASSPDAKAGLDRYRARPERTTPGLQASYYRQRLALPLLNENGLLVFDDATNKQLFTEVMVRDDKSRKKMRRMTSSASLTAAGPTASSSSSSTTTTATGGKGVSPDDARVHLVLYFPERVTYYDYWFVSEEDKALARQRTYERNMQRHQRGLPSWHPGNDDPESGILTRSKD